jgi:hypothetical protein
MCPAILLVESKTFFGIKWEKQVFWGVSSALYCIVLYIFVNYITATASRGSGMDNRLTNNITYFLSGVFNRKSRHNAEHTCVSKKRSNPSGPLSVGPFWPFTSE